jgi:hypothetical protein
MSKVGFGIAHYPTRHGASHGNANEHDESKVWTALTVAALEEAGVVCTVGPVGSLRPKVEALNEAKCDLAIEIHFNSVSGGNAQGSETLYYPGSTKGKAAALIMQKHLSLAMGTPDRGAKEGWYKMDRPGVVDWYGDEDGDEMPDYFLRKTNCPSLILEPEFIQQYGHIKNSRKVGTTAIAKAVLEILALWEVKVKPETKLKSGKEKYSS